MTKEHICSMSRKGSSIKSSFKKLVTFNDIPNQQCYYPVFTVVMTIVYVSILLLTYTENNTSDRRLISTLFNLGYFFLPCMRPTSREVRMRIVHCTSFVESNVCHYDDIIRHVCHSFAYPHQIWRMITPNLFHTTWLHLLSNLSALLIQGIPLECKHGSLRVALIYWLSELGVNLLPLPSLSKELGIGASGSLYSWMLFLVVDRLVQLQANRNRWCFIIVQLSFFLLPFVVLSIILAARYHVQHAVHICGAVLGLLFGIYFIGCPLVTINAHNMFNQICQHIALALLTLYFVMTTIFFVFRKAPILETVVYSYSLYNQTVLDLHELVV